MTIRNEASTGPAHSALCVLSTHVAMATVINHTSFQQSVLSLLIIAAVIPCAVNTVPTADTSEQQRPTSLLCILLSNVLYNRFISLFVVSLWMA